MALFPVVPARAELANAPSLTISQLKITSSNGQFVTLYNSTDQTLDMSKYQLEYFNNYDASKATSSRLIALTGMLAPHSYYMVNDSAQLLCFQMTVDSLSLGFSSTAGMVEILGFVQTSPGAPVAPSLIDYVGWSKTAAIGAQTLPSNTNAFLQRVSAAPSTWQAVQPNPSDPCSLVTANTAGPIVPANPADVQLLPGTEPAAIFTPDATTEPAQQTDSTSPDNGLMAPLITELLPNPTGTGNDSLDEFIELYNPNAAQFLLSGFSLQTGTTSVHTYTFPAGAAIPANSYAVFYSLTTGLSMSNTTGQARLLSPAGTQIAASEIYSNAQDGQTWALASGKWQWTTHLTPGSTNIIALPPAKKSKKTSSRSTTKKSSGAVKGASTKTKSAKLKTGAGALVSADSSAETRAPLHTWVLVSVGGLAVLYGAYEYRADIGNRIYELRRYISTRRKNRT